MMPCVCGAPTTVVATNSFWASAFPSASGLAAIRQNLPRPLSTRVIESLSGALRSPPEKKSDGRMIRVGELNKRGSKSWSSAWRVLVAVLASQSRMRSTKAGAVHLSLI